MRERVVIPLRRTLARVERFVQPPGALTVPTVSTPRTGSEHSDRVDGALRSGGWSTPIGWMEHSARVDGALRSGGWSTPLRWRERSERVDGAPLSCGRRTWSVWGAPPNLRRRANHAAGAWP